MPGRQGWGWKERGYHANLCLIAFGILALHMRPLSRNARIQLEEGQVREPPDRASLDGRHEVDRYGSKGQGCYVGVLGPRLIDTCGHFPCAFFAVILSLSKNISRWIPRVGCIAITGVVSWCAPESYPSTSLGMTGYVSSGAWAYVFPRTSSLAEYVPRNTMFCGRSRISHAR